MSTSHAASDAIVASLRQLFGDRLLSLVVYGGHAEHDGGDRPITSLALVRSLTVR